MVEVLRVSTKSNPNAVAGALAGVIREKGSAELQTIGAGALESGGESDRDCQRLPGPLGNGSDLSSRVRRHHG